MRLLDEREHDSGEPGRTERSTEEVDPAPGCPCRSRDRCDHEYQGRENDRNVEREDPPPGGLVDDHASSERADDRRDSAQAVQLPIAPLARARRTPRR